MDDVVTSKHGKKIPVKKNVVAKAEKVMERGKVRKNEIFSISLNQCTGSESLKPSARDIA